VAKATATVTAKGLYELHLNGQRVGDRLLAPEWTSYRKRIQVQTYDVTGLLRQGANAVGAMVAEGWYAGRLMAMPRFPYGSNPSFLFQLEGELTDGSRQTIVTDGTWRSTTAGPIRSAGIYDGESYDARQEMAGWDRARFVAADWSKVEVEPLGPERLVWQPNEPIRVVKTLQPRVLTEPKPGVYIIDFGQNLVGWCRVKVLGKAGQTITLRHGEMLAENGTLYTANLRGAPQTDRVIPRQDGPIAYEPRFTYHGFRYLELTGLAAPPSIGSVRASVFHSTSPDVGSFSCSDPLLNRLMDNIIWTQRGNLMSSPNDCPQRDERFGWMGDIQAFGQTAMFNMDMAAFFTKFVRDVRDDQAEDGRFPDFAPHPGDPNQKFSGAPAWADAGTIVPWRAYQNYADTRLLSEHFEAARRWVDYIHRRNPELVWAEGRNNDYNDWLNGDTIKRAGWPSQGGAIPNAVFATAFFAHSTQLVAQMAERIGRVEDARNYHALAERIRTTFNRRFVRPDGRIQGHTQAGYALALNFDLLPIELRPQATRYLVEGIRRYGNHLSTGIQTTHRAMLELMRYGEDDLAWQLLTSRSFPSWLYMIDNGATTIWERWDGYVEGRGFQDPGMNSFNHWAFGAIGEWMWRHIVGLNPDETQPGWKHFTIAPRPGGDMTWAKGRYRSIRGLIASEWRIENDRFELQLTVPPNTTATLHLPTSDASQVTESGTTSAPDHAMPHRATYELQSGRYHFSAPAP
jgi:alpha-L-rhamnosidase